MDSSCSCFTSNVERSVFQRNAQPRLQGLVAPEPTINFAAIKFIKMAKCPGHKVEECLHSSNNYTTWSCCNIPKLKRYTIL